MSVVADVLGLYRARGTGAYFGERVSMTEHALQSAHFARCAGAADTLVLAALLHDIGHLLEAVPDQLEEWTCDAHHELTGARWLARHFAAEVSEPVRLHVLAKRYLCATDSDYGARLSPASVHTLTLQGGLLTPAEIAQFEAEPFHREAVCVRRCDDQGKVAGLATPALEDYAALIARLERAR
jgi:[1-hydroxy-2-(trimethylamino)ethyl]phosphonate dioxygenase